MVIRRRGCSFRLMYPQAAYRITLLQKLSHWVESRIARKCSAFAPESATLPLAQRCVVPDSLDLCHQRGDSRFHIDILAKHALFDAAPDDARQVDPPKVIAALYGKLLLASPPRYLMPSSALIKAFTPSRPRKRSQSGPSSCSATSSDVRRMVDCSAGKRNPYPSGNSFTSLIAAFTCSITVLCRRLPSASNASMLQAKGDSFFDLLCPAAFSPDW